MSPTFEVPFSHPEAQRLIRAAYGEVRSGRTVKIETATRHFVTDHWDGGSREECRFVRLADGAALPADALPATARQREGNPLGLARGEIALADGYAFVLHVIFQGKDLGYRILLHPANVAPWLTAAPAVELTERERSLLNVFATYVSSYRKPELARMNATPAEIDALVVRGLLARNAKGAIACTPAGKAAGKGRTYLP